MRRRVTAVAVAAVIAVIAIAGCAASPSTSVDRPATGSSLAIDAAASLKSVLDKVKTAYEAANPGVTLTISTDSSAALETKIEQGAPADVFLSADTANPQKLVDKGLANGPVTPIAGNALTVIVPKANPAGVRTPVDLARSGLKVVAAGDAVPITKYAAQLVANLAKVAGYPADFAARYAANVVSREDSVAGIVSKVALGEADAGIVYATDAATSADVATVPVPDSANVPATYGGVVVAASHDAAVAARFLAWLAGPDGQAILKTFGFRPAS